VAAGEHATSTQQATSTELDRPAPLERGAVVTPSGRVSVAVELDPDRRDSAFSPAELTRLDEALTMASRDTGLRFNLYLGDLGSDPTGVAQRILARLGEAAGNSVLIAVSPEQRQIEIITGHEALQRLPDRGAKLGVMTMAASFKKGALFAGLLAGLHMLADQASGRPRRV
jgi:hypothetical protein